ncbi:molecular chaperone DnaJ [Erysipelothrix rhusiopathiae]|uniref:Chaperone protein DnaJ n=1 Tax=Erysipelothrix rhusiopathiae TaxID=1648 RepID=DNAJ_ERYRH|nr:molecular chaperone DnaJ [Erysipelothrix rhusiopathiae]Q05646.1 RecName: Full=Chaperone protein DnaJ [Erysipelothrix rhusiopathiae]AAA71922.1 dnaJ [Erysipelothrix rhusiopathiae]AGN23809.1 chaperone protein DnaJ [Erysipelothrix rhusiopathiae SY1027]AMS11423.1 molecular chaperone DnaJ [Erysipelothrix rhusiopathiae]AOO67921.1 molecular chaperone DnaJ [Erysipelothrix rhusiopathiae]AWU41232.1 molecular chaperone DnaJ [Erysipelothrix rhusiopathiae]
MADKRDFYEILGVSKSATDAEIKKAYRQLAKKYHPDINKEDGAEAKFKEVQEAYEVLSDSQKRANYDQFGHAAFDQGAGGFGGGFSGGFDDFGDIFSSFFGGGGGGQRRNPNGPMKGQDRFMSMRIDFMEAVFGANKSVTLNVDEECTSCHGSGAHSKDDIKTCSRCGGTGQTVTQQRTPFGVFQSQATCPDCGGSGKTITKRCGECHGKGFNTKRVEVDIKIPAGIVTGQQLRVSGKGERGANGGPNGDLFIEIVVGTHKHFRREGNDIHINIPLSVIDATLGTEIEVPTVHGDVKLTIPAGTQPNTKFRLREKGVQDLRSGRMGDQYVEVKLEVPTKLSRQQREHLEALKETEVKGDSVFDRFKKAFK